MISDEISDLTYKVREIFSISCRWKRYEERQVQNHVCKLA